MPGLCFHNVDFSYPGRAVCRNVEWRIPDAGITGIIGPNGAGKTTLLKLAAGLLKPDAGRIELDGTDAAAMDAKARARVVAFVPQTEQMVFPYTVEQMVMLGRYAHLHGPGYESDADREAVSRAIERCGIEHLRKRNVTELSGGELHRVLFARALAQETPLLLLDEPTAFMDIAYQVAMFDLLLHMRGEHKKTIVCVTHDLNIALSYFDEVGILADGTIQAHGAPESVLTPEAIANFFGVPVSVQKPGGSQAPFIQIHSPYRISETRDS